MRADRSAMGEFTSENRLTAGYLIVAHVALFIGVILGFFQALEYAGKRWEGTGMYKRILVPLDGSSLAEGVLRHVQDLAKSVGAEVVVLRVAFAHTFPGADAVEPQVTAVQEAETYVADLAKRLQDAGVRATGKVRYGDPVEEILDHVTWDHIDLIAMATHGRTGLRRVMLGSVAEHVLRRAPVPMLLLRAHALEAVQV